MSIKTNENETLASYYFKNVTPLVVIAVVFAFLLGLAYQFLEPAINETVRREETRVLANVFSSASSFEPIISNGVTNNKAVNASGEALGYVFKASNNGYGGPVVAMVGIKDGKIVKVAIASMDNETPGLGTKAGNEEWLAQFEGITKDKVPTSKEGYRANGLDAVSGATFSSMAVARDLTDAFDMYDNIQK